MRGLDWNNPYRVRTWKELINWINEIGFLPLFANEVEGFSAEEHVSPNFWWTGDPEAVWGYDLVTSAYKEKTHESWEKIMNHVKEQYPDADESDIIRLIGKEPGL